MKSERTLLEHVSHQTSILSRVFHDEHVGNDAFSSDVLAAMDALERLQNHAEADRFKIVTHDDGKVDVLYPER